MELLAPSSYDQMPAWTEALAQVVTAAAAAEQRLPVLAGPTAHLTYMQEGSPYRASLVAREVLGAATGARPFGRDRAANDAIQVYARARTTEQLLLDARAARPEAGSNKAARRALHNAAAAHETAAAAALGQAATDTARLNEHLAALTGASASVLLAQHHEPKAALSWH